MKLQGMINAPMFAEGHVGVCSIHAACACIGQMINLCMSAGLQNIGEGYDIALNIGVWLLQAISNTGLSGEMNYPVERPIGKAVIDRMTVSKIGAVKSI